MYFRVYYKNGSKIIKADNLDDAERICNERYKTWTDIKLVQRGKKKER